MKVILNIFCAMKLVPPKDLGSVVHLNIILLKIVFIVSIGTFQPSPPSLIGTINVLTSFILVVILIVSLNLSLLERPFWAYK